MGIPLVRNDGACPRHGVGTGKDAAERYLGIVPAKRIDDARAANQAVDGKKLPAAEADAGGHLEILEDNGAENERGV